jgi:hypothetical protein
MNIPLHNKEGHVCERITTEAGFSHKAKKLHSFLVFCHITTLCHFPIGSLGA